MEGCGPSTSTPCAPWWTRFEQCAERTANPAGCSIRTLEAIECRADYGPDGKPFRRCQRILRKFRECPGRAAEEIETVVTHSDLAESDPFPGLPPEKPDVLQPHVGEAFEEFFKIAEELSRTLAIEGEELPNELLRQQQQASQKASKQRESSTGTGLLGRLFGWPQGTSGAAQGEGPAWEQFENSFEET